MAAIAKRQSALLIDVSTSEIYGGGKGGFCAESGGSIVSCGASARKEYAVGKLAAEKALKAGITEVTFDRGGYLYHGRIKSLAEGARAAGLKF